MSNNSSHKILQATVSAVDGNDYSFFFSNNFTDVDDLINHIKNESIIECCDKYGDNIHKSLSFIKLNIIRVVVRKIDAEVKPESTIEQDIQQD